MLNSPLTTKEAERLRALRSYEILDTRSEPVFDDICRLASTICKKPIGFLSFVDEKRSWFKAKHSWVVSEIPLDASFCARAILTPQLMIVKDTLADERFRNNPMVQSDPGIRFYAAAPLTTIDGYAIGTLSVMDTQPGDLSEEERNHLVTLAGQAMSHLEARRSLAEMASSKRLLEEMGRAIRASEKQVFRFLETIPVGIFVIDRQGSPYYANHAAQQILGRGIAPGASTENLSEVYQSFIAGTLQEYPPEQTPIVRALSGESTMIDNMEIRRGETVIPLQVWGAPIHDDDGNVTYAIVAFMDIPGIAGQSVVSQFSMQQRTSSRSLNPSKRWCHGYWNRSAKVWIGNSEHSGFSIPTRNY